MDSTTTISLMQTALVLGISMREVSRLIREHKLRVHHKVNKVKFVDASNVLSYIRSVRS